MTAHGEEHHLIARMRNVTRMRLQLQMIRKVTVLLAAPVGAPSPLHYPPRLSPLTCLALTREETADQLLQSQQASTTSAQL
jgi:hypothetical protein